MIIFLIIIGGKKMNPSYYRISLDIHDATSQLTFSIKKGDTSRRLLISLMDNGVPYEITADCYATFSARKADKELVFNDCTIQNNMIIYDITEQTSSVEGRLDCEIVLNGLYSGQITSPRFTMIVYASVYTEEEVESSSEYKSLATMIEEGNPVINDGKELMEQLEPYGEALENKYDKVDTVDIADNSVSVNGTAEVEPEVVVDTGTTIQPGRIDMVSHEAEAVYHPHSIHYKQGDGEQIGLYFPDKSGTFATEEWVEGKLSSVELDTTLTEEGKAADAKAVGDAIKNIDLSSSVELDTTLTEEGKAADAKAVGDELDKKLDKYTTLDGIFKVYATDGSGNQNMVRYSSAAVGSTLAYRAPGGKVKTGEPQDADDATSKKYVDNLPDNLTLDDTAKETWQQWLNVVPKLPSEGNYKLYGVAPSGKLIAKTIMNTPTNAGVEIIPWYFSANSEALDTEATLKTSLYTATPQRNYAAANKKYVDDNFISKDAPSGTANKLFGSDSNGKVVYRHVNLADTATQGSIPIYRVGGVLPVGTPDLGHYAANKQYVDDQITANQIYRHRVDIYAKDDSSYFCFEFYAKDSTKLDLSGNTHDKLVSLIKKINRTSSGNDLGICIFGWAKDGSTKKPIFFMDPWGNPDTSDTIRLTGSGFVFTTLNQKTLQAGDNVFPIYSGTLTL